MPERKIVRKKQNWLIFEEIATIPRIVSTIQVAG